MPTLNQYVENSDKQGYYIRAYAGGSTPVTLQVTDLAAVLLRLAEYVPDEFVPTKIVWSMYNIGLLYTLESLDISPTEKGIQDPNGIIDLMGLDSKLTEEERDRVVSSLENYKGPDQDIVDKLIDELGYDFLENVEYSEIANQKITDTTNLFTWIENKEELKELASNNGDYVLFCLCSLMTFANCNYISASKALIRDDKSIEYGLSHKRYEDPISIRDYRYKPNRGYEFIIHHATGDESVEVSKNGYVLDYENDAGRKGSYLRIDATVKEIFPEDTVDFREIIKKRRKRRKERGKEEKRRKKEKNRANRKRYRREQRRDIKQLFSDLDKSSVWSSFSEEQMKLIKKVEPDASRENTFIDVIDRISNKGNPVIEMTNGHVIVDRGEPGDKVLFFRPNLNSVVACVIAKID